MQNVAIIKLNKTSSSMFVVKKYQKLVGGLTPRKDTQNNLTEVAEK